MGSYNQPYIIGMVGNWEAQSLQRLEQTLGDRHRTVTKLTNSEPSPTLSHSITHTEPCKNDGQA